MFSGWQYIKKWHGLIFSREIYKKTNVLYREQNPKEDSPKAWVVFN